MIRNKIFTIVAITTIASFITMLGCDTEPPASPESVQDEQLGLEHGLTRLDEPEVSLGKHGVLTPADRQLLRELRQARKATKKYRDVEEAVEDGYVDVNVVVPGQGHHYLKAELLDANFDLRHPELLLYAPISDNNDDEDDENHLRLVAVEYAVPIDLSPTPPEGFTGDSDEWVINDAFGLWTLHAWIWLPNPDGVFAETNPLVP
jgi:hypothetical protein